MSRISTFACLLICLPFLISESASAQYYGNSGYGGGYRGYGSGYGGYGSGYAGGYGGAYNPYGGCGTAPSPWLGYCLTNDCFCQGGAGGAGGGCGGYGGSGGGYAIVRVQVGDGEPIYRRVPIQYGYPGDMQIPGVQIPGVPGAQVPAAVPANQRFVGPPAAPQTSSRTSYRQRAHVPSNVRKASYRYKF